MKFGLSDLWQMIWLTILQPNEGFRRVLAVAPSAEARWTGLLAVSVVSVLLYGALTLGIDDGVLDPLSQAMRHPVSGVILQACWTVIVAAAIAGIGQRFGGKARFAEALTLTVWVEAVVSALQAVVLLSSWVLPPLASILALVALAIFVRLMTYATAYVNGFRRLHLVFLGILATLVLFVLGVAIVLSVLGIMPDLPSGSSHV